MAMPKHTHCVITAVAFAVLAWTASAKDTVVVVDTCSAQDTCSRPDGNAMLVFGSPTTSDDSRRRRSQRGTARVLLADDKGPSLVNPTTTGQVENGELRLTRTVCRRGFTGPSCRFRSWSSSATIRSRIARP